MEEIIELEAIVGPQSELKKLAKSFGEKRGPEKVIYWMRKGGKVPKKYMKYQSLSLKQAKNVTKNFKRTVNGGYLKSGCLALIEDKITGL